MTLIRMNLGMKSIFYMRLDIHKYIYLIQSIHMGKVRYTWTFKKYLPILSLQYAYTELSYDADILHMDRSQQKQPIAGGFPNFQKGSKSFLFSAKFHGHEL